MASFSDEDRMSNRADFWLLQNGAIHVCNSAEELDRQLNALTTLGYDVARLDMRIPDFHAHVSEVLGFPDYYGRNLDALNDCLTDIAIKPESGLVVVLDNVHQGVFEYVATLASIFEDASYMHLLFGARLLVLIHTDDKHLRAECNRQWRLVRRPPPSRSGML